MELANRDRLFLIRNSIASHILNSFQCRQFLETGSTGFLDLDLSFFFSSLLTAFSNCRMMFCLLESVFTARFRIIV